MLADQSILQLARLFDFLEDVQVWVKDRTGRYCWANRAFLLNFEAGSSSGVSGRSLAGILGKTDYDLSPPWLADQFRLDDELVLKGTPIINRIELVIQPEGAATWHITNKIPLLDKKGKVIGTAGMTRPHSSDGEGSSPDFGFGRALVHMRDRYQDHLGNRELAAAAHMSLRAFERKFLSRFRLTPQQYLRKLRLRMASRALVFSRDTLAAVAQSCGFSDQSHFTREFRKQFGRTPRAYRERYARNPSPAAFGTNSDANEQ